MAASLIKTQAELEAQISQVGLDRPEHERREIQERGLAQIEPFLKFHPDPDTINRLHPVAQ